MVTPMIFHDRKRRGRRWLRRIGSLALLGLLLTAYPGKAATVEAELRPEETPVGRGVNLTITFEDTAPESPPEIRIPRSIKKRYSGRQQRFISRSGGETRRQWIFTYRLIPSKTGKFQIPGQTFQVGNETLRTEPLALRVIEQSRSSNNGDSPNYAFIELAPTKTTLFAGENFPITIDLYIAVGVRVPQLQRPQIEADGFTFGSVPRKPERQQVRRHGRRYRKFSFNLRASPVKTGPLTLGPATAKMVIEVPQSGRRSLFSARESRNLRVKSRKHTIHVKELPQDDVPENFNGAIGQFDLLVKATPTEVNVGDPVTYEVTIQGKGTLEALSLPEQAWPGFKTYPPSVTDQKTGRLGIKGTKRFELVVMPENAELEQIPPFRFSYFDPEEKRYKELEHSPISISVDPGKSDSNRRKSIAQGDAGSATQNGDNELAHIKAHPGKPMAFSPPLISRPWFLGLQAIPVMAWLGGLVIRKRHHYLLQNPHRLRTRRVRREVRSGLAELERLAAEDDSPKFAAKLFRLLQEQLGERLGLPASSITEEVLEGRLRQEGAPSELIQTLHELFAICNEERYAPHRHRPELHALLSKIHNAFRELGSYETPKDQRPSIKSTSTNIKRPS